MPLWTFHATTVSSGLTSLQLREVDLREFECRQGTVVPYAKGDHFGTDSA